MERSTFAARLLGLSGVSLDLFSMFAVMTFVGIGVDYGIHLVHRCAHGDPADRVSAVAHLGPVILVAALTTLLGFGTLVTSSYPPLWSRTRRRSSGWRTRSVAPGPP